jgi:hypothetical protein
MTDLKTEGDARQAEDYLRECTSIYPEQIEEEFVRTPADVAYWNARYAEALEVSLRAKHFADSEWARIWLLHREERLAGGDKATEKVLENLTLTDPAYQAAREAMVVADVEKAKAYGHIDAVHTKKDMLQSLGAKLRAEMSSDPQVREQVRQGSMR